MATLHIRDLPDEVHAALRRRAGSEGTSMEALARKLLSDAVQKPRARRPASVQLLVQRLYEGRMPEGVVDDFLAERRKSAGEE